MKRQFVGYLMLLTILAGCGASGNTPVPDAPDYFTEINPTLRWSSTKTASPLKVFVGLDGAADRSAEVLADAQVWATATGSVVRFVGTASASDADITVLFSDTVKPEDGGVGITRVSFNNIPTDPALDGIIQRSEITLKRGVSSTLLRPTMEHQIGHSLGIVGRNAGDNAHSSYVGDVMYPIVNESSAISSRDIATLVKLYSLSRVR